VQNRDSVGMERCSPQPTVVQRSAIDTPMINVQDRIEDPNETTRQALEDALNRRNLESFESAEALFADLGI